MKLKLKVIAMFVLCTFIACEQSSKSSSKKSKISANSGLESGLETPALEDFERQVLAGEIEGQAWTYLSGKATKGRSADKVYLTLFESAYDNPCDVVLDSNARAVVAEVDLQAGLVELGDFQRVNLTIFDQELIRTIPVKKGVIKIQSYGDATLKGAMLAVYDEANYLEGSFEAVFCR